jgi:hypothetical protein
MSADRGLGNWLTSAGAVTGALGISTVSLLAVILAQSAHALVPRTFHEGQGATYARTTRP